jgi:methionyl aminopeptidase
VFRKSIYKSPAQLRLMVEPGLLTEAALRAVREAIRPGVTTLELDAIAERTIRSGGGRPNFQLVPGYRHTICASVGADVVHGIPDDVPLVAGDIVSIDCGADVGGWNGDSAFTIVLDDPERPDVVRDRRALSDVTERSMWAGIARLARARHLNEVGEAVQEAIESRGDFGIIVDYIGHGIGRSMHEAPPVFNYRVSHKGPDVKPGLAVAIEPMVVERGVETFVQDDDWTVTTVDGGMASHWEHSVAVHDDGIWVLTASDGGAAGLAPFGVTPVPIA